MTSSAEPAPSKPKRRWLQFSLRTLLVLVLLVAALCGWLRHKVNQSEQERRAVEAILAMGGNVDYEHEIVGGQRKATDPPGPQWLRAVLGDHFFARLEIVWYPPGVGDESLVHLDGLRHLSELHLGGTSVTDAGLAHVTRHRELGALDLAATSVTDAGIAQLECLPNVTFLGLDHTAVTDRSVETLLQFDRVGSASFVGTAVSAGGYRKMQATVPPDGFMIPWERAPSENERRIVVALVRRGAIVELSREHEEAEAEYELSLANPLWRGSPSDLANLTRLRHFRLISLHRVELNDELVEALRVLSNLKYLYVRDTPVTHAQWVRLTRGKSPGEAPGDSSPEGLSNLQGLSLVDVPVTDAELRLIAKWTNLTELSLVDTQVTDSGLAHLKGLTKLESLDLSGTRITDAGLVHLEGLRKLEFLDLEGINFGPQGAANRARLEKALPELLIRR